MNLAQLKLENALKCDSKDPRNIRDRDIYRTPIDEIGSIQVLQTYKDGVCVFDRNAN